jgi:S-adenosylmethionine-dependent methyltransferase
MSDRNFDDLAGRFAQNIYDNPKGQIRLQLVWDELLVICPQLMNGKPLRILDAGCGMGQMTARLSALGHQVLCCDISAAMLSETKQMLGGQNPGALANVRFIQSSVQTLDQHLADESFDLIIFHAVLEWMEEPEAGLQSLLKWLKPGAVLSIMFYNLHSLIFKNLLRGNFRKIEEQDFRGDPGSLTPIHPLDPVDVEQWLSRYGLTVLGKRGIRSFYDYMDHSMKHKKLVIAMEDVIRMEKKFGVQEPYRSLSRYILIHCSSKTSE